MLTQEAPHPSFIPACVYGHKHIYVEAHPTFVLVSEDSNSELVPQLHPHLPTCSLRAPEPVSICTEPRELR